MPKKKNSKKPTAAQARQNKIEALMSKAASAREKNQHLIQACRGSKSLADKVREQLCADLRRVFEIPRHILGPSASRRRYREHGHYSEELVTMLIGSWAEFKRQAQIEDSLPTKQIERNIATTLRAQQVAEYADRYVKPWDGAYDSLDMSQDHVTLMIGSDFHSKFMDPFARRVWREVLRQVQPDGVRYNGDGPDFPSLSRHRQMPGHFLLSLQGEVDMWTQVMREDREDNPEGDHKWLLGNHDIRLVLAMADNSPMYASLESMRFNEMFKLDELNVGLVARSTFLNPTAAMKKTDIAQNWETLRDAEGRPFWTTVHGYLCGKDAPAKHLARFMTFGTNGHLHDPKSTAGGSLATGPLRWWQTGCMAYPPGVAAGYMPGPVEFSGWATTFLVVHLFPRHRHVQVEEVHVGELATYGDYIYQITEEELAQRDAMLEV